MQKPIISAAERFAICIALVALLLYPAGDALEYRRALLASQPWRALTAHLVHVNVLHLLLNAAALVLIARLFAPELRPRRQFAVLLIAAIAIAAAFAWVWPGVAWYRGMSGVLHALYFAGATSWLVAAWRDRRRFAVPVALRLPLPFALLAGGAIKVALETPWTSATPYAHWLGANVVPQAHLVGALCGSVIALAWAIAARGGQRNQQQQLSERN